jgi:hypothetical protein
MKPLSRPRPSFETQARACSQDEDLFRGDVFFTVLLSALFFAIVLATSLLAEAFVFFARGRFFAAARCAAPSAALAHWLNSSVSSNSRAGSCQ